MMENLLFNQLRAAFPQLKDISDPASKRILAHIKPMSFKKGDIMAYQGTPCTHQMMLAHGVVKVFTRTENGREIVLYRVKAGECCVLTTSCLLSNTPFPVEGVAETDVEAFALPAQHFSKGLESSSDFRQFVFSAYTARVNEMVLLVGKIAATKIDQRLIEYLLAYCQDCNVVAITHDALAKELGSVREVVSRNLKEFEQRGWVQLSRGKISLIDRESLEQYLLDLKWA